MALLQPKSLRASDHSMRGELLTRSKARYPARPLRFVAGSREPVQEPVPEGLLTRVAEVLPDGSPWSMHVGAYRVLYAVEGTTVWVLAVVLKGRKTLAETFS